MQLLLELSKLKEEQTERQNGKLESDRRLNSALEEERLSMNDLQWYRSIKSELAKSKIPVQDISKLVNVILGFKIFNYDPMEIHKEISKRRSLSEENYILQGENVILKQIQTGIYESI